jgi:hypothetical protein
MFASELLLSRNGRRHSLTTMHLGSLTPGLLVLGLLALPNCASAQTTYHDPQGRYDFQVPDGWQVTPDQDPGQVIVRKGNSQAIVAMVKQNPNSLATAKEFVDLAVKGFQGQCPTFQQRQSGTLKLAGGQGEFALVTCSDLASPAVAETSAVLDGNLYVVGFMMIAPLRDYYANLPILDGIRNSLQVPGAGKVFAVANATESQAMTELKKACAVGAFNQEDCARRVGTLLGQEAGQDKTGPDPGSAAGNVYRDGSGRFSLKIPAGWHATPEGDNGVLGVQLRNGSDWINVMPADAAASASEVVLNQERQIAAKSNSARKPPFGAIGLVQLFGNGVEVTYDHFSASTAQGDAVESYIGGVGDISGAGHNFLLVISSTGAREKDKDSGIFISVAQSIQLGGR